MMKKSYSADLNSLGEIAADIDAFCASAGAPQAAFALNLSAEELFANAAKHGYKSDSSKRVELALSTDGHAITMTVSDTAPKFNPFADAPEPDTALGIEERGVGGLGVFFVKKNVDSYKYEYVGGRNVITLTKKI